MIGEPTNPGHSQIDTIERNQSDPTTHKYWAKVGLFDDQSILARLERSPPLFARASSPPTPGALPRVEVRTKYNSSLYFEFSMLWKVLPICTVIDDDVAVLHGGLCYDDVTLADLEGVPQAMTAGEDRHLNDILWSDPDPTGAGRTANADRGGGILKFGADVTRTFLSTNGLHLLVRSHQLPSNPEQKHPRPGFEWLHDGQVPPPPSPSPDTTSARRARDARTRPRADP